MRRADPLRRSGITAVSPVDDAPSASGCEAPREGDLAGLEAALRVLSGSDPRRLRLLREGADARARVLERYAAVPGLPHASGLLPIDAGRAVLRTALAQHAAGAGSVFARGAARALGLASGFGLARPLLRQRVAVTAAEPEQTETPVHGFLAGVLGRTDFVISLRLAPGRPNGKPVVQAIAADSAVLAYAKFGWEPVTRGLLRHEAATLSEVAPLVGRTALRVPEVMHAGPWCGLEALVLAPLTDAGRRPRRPTEIPAAASAALGGLPPRTAGRLGDSAFWRRTTSRTARSAPALEPPGGALLGAAVAQIETAWGDVSLPFGRIHGDWIPANLVVRPDGLVNAWDWERAATDAPLGVDSMQFLIYLEMRRRRPDWTARGRLARLGRDALAREGLDPGTTPLLTALVLIEMLLWYAEAAEAGRHVDARRIVRVVGALTAVLDLR